jgi:solute carrier family 50 protein (sugar transporter)
MIGVILGIYYFRTYTRYCTKMGSNQQIRMHFRGASCIIVCNLFLTQMIEKELAAKIIGKEGVLYCVILFASPLAALKNVLETKSAVSIPLPFTVACFINCLCWSITGLFKMQDFNIYFPNLLGLSCACAQLLLKGMFSPRWMGRRGGGSGLPSEFESASV